MISTLYPGTVRMGCTVFYPSDKQREDLEEEELRPLLVTTKWPERIQVVDGLLPAVDYLEARITGTCDAQYSCAEMYDLCHVLQIFNPLSPPRFDPGLWTTGSNSSQTRFLS